MVRLLVTLLCALCLAPAAGAGGSAAGDGALSILSGNGWMTIVGKGTIYGQLDKGTLTVTDPDPTDGTIQVVGAEQTRPKGLNVTVYTGKNITFRLVGGRYKLAIAASTGVDLLAVGVGKAWLRGDPTAPNAGTYTVDGSRRTPIPVAPATPPAAGATWAGVLVPFGSAPPATTTTASP